MFGRSCYTIDSELLASIQKECRRPEKFVKLITSKNYTSPALMAVHAPQLTNKYADCYPGNRYFIGCEFVNVEAIQ